MVRFFFVVVVVKCLVHISSSLPPSLLSVRRQWGVDVLHKIFEQVPRLSTTRLTSTFQVQRKQRAESGLQPQAQRGLLQQGLEGVQGRAEGVLRREEEGDGGHAARARLRRRRRRRRRPPPSSTSASGACTHMCRSRGGQTNRVLVCLLLALRGKAFIFCWLCCCPTILMVSTVGLGVFLPGLGRR